MKILSVVGARPQFIKLGPVSKALRQRHTEVIVNTGQHYDPQMSDVFLRELEIARPDHDLGVGSGSHAEQTAKMLTGIEAIILQEKADAVLVFGDTNSTLAAALAATKIHVPVAHVEAGLRSFNRAMPEEVNRVLTDHVSDLLFCPTDVAVANLAREGITRGVHQIGDVMLDAAQHYGPKAESTASLRKTLGLDKGGYLLATIHRASNTDDREILSGLLGTFAAIEEPIVFPVHPRTRKALADAQLAVSSNVHIVDPVGYFEMLALEQGARMILTDSGGVQKEAFFFGIPCVTMRTETEWVELVEAGWNKVVGFDRAAIVDAVRNWKPTAARPALYGKGDSSVRIAALLEELSKGSAR